MKALKFLPKAVIFFVCLGYSFAWGQVEVRDDSKVWIGPHDPWTHPTDRQLTVTGKAYFSCDPSSSGIWFEHKEYSNGNAPVIEPQWGNTANLGRGFKDKPFNVVSARKFYYTDDCKYSDASFKDNINSLNGSTSLNQVKSLNPVSYTYNDGFWNKMGNDSMSVVPDNEKYRTRKGFLAQEVKAVIPDIVEEHDEGYGLYQSELTPVLTGAVQEQQSQIENLQSQVEALQLQIQDMQEQLNSCDCVEGTE